jgi:hypothetical protein
MTKLKYDDGIYNSFILQPFLRMTIMTVVLVNSWGMRNSWNLGCHRAVVCTGVYTAGTAGLEAQTSILITVGVKSKSKSHYNWRSVSQYVLVSSPLWDLWSDFFFSSKLLSCLCGGALSDERSGLSFVSLLSIQSIVASQYLRKLLRWSLGRYSSFADSDHGV